MRPSVDVVCPHGHVTTSMFQFKLLLANRSDIAPDSHRVANPP